MTGRVVTVARCRRRGHVLGKVIAGEQGGLRLEAPRLAAGGRGKTTGEIRRIRGSKYAGPLPTPGYDSMTYPVTCECGFLYLLNEADLLSGLPLLECDPVR